MVSAAKKKLGGNKFLESNRFQAYLERSEERYFEVSDFFCGWPTLLNRFLSISLCVKVRF